MNMFYPAVRPFCHSVIPEEVYLIRNISSEDHEKESDHVGHWRREEEANVDAYACESKGLGEAGPHGMCNGGEVGPSHVPDPVCAYQCLHVQGTLTPGQVDKEADRQGCEKDVRCALEGANGPFLVGY